MSFDSLHFVGWRQFQYVSIEFDPRMTVLTGANGSGKTAILRILARHFGWWFQELSTPVLDPKRGGVRFLISLLRSDELRELMSDPALSTKERLAIAETIGMDKSLSASDSEITSEEDWYGQHYREIGRVNYGREHQEHASVSSKIYVPRDTEGSTYELQIRDQPHVDGIFIPSHRADFFYRPVESIPLQPRSTDQISNQIVNALRNRSLYLSEQNVPPSYYMKETLLSWAIIGSGNSVVLPDPEKIEFFESFQEVARTVLPPTLGFRRLQIRPPEIVLSTDTGEFMLDAVSGGIGAILDLAWQIFIRDPTRREAFTVIIDEVENHLHASMQRTILPGLYAAFPNVQFVVSTHSPLIVGSVQQSTVYALRYNRSRRVESELLDLDARTGTASEILREVLDVPVTTPIWAERYLKHLADRYEKEAPSQEVISELRHSLISVGLEELAPQAIADLLGRWEHS